MPAVPRRPIVSAASGHFSARAKRLNVVQSCPAKVCFEHDVNADVLFLGHEEEAAVHAMPEMDLRLPRIDIALCDRVARDRCFQLVQRTVDEARMSLSREIFTISPAPLLSAGYGIAEANCRTSVGPRGRSCSGR